MDTNCHPDRMASILICRRGSSIRTINRSRLRRTRPGRNRIMVSPTRIPDRVQRPESAQKLQPLPRNTMERGGGPNATSFAGSIPVESAEDCGASPGRMRLGTIGETGICCPVARGCTLADILEG